MVSDEAQWYVQKGSRVQGPYSTPEVGRYLLLGRVRNTDRVSRDGELWEPVTQVPELIPEELLDLDSEFGWSRVLNARSAEDERKRLSSISRERRAAADPTPDQLRDDWMQDTQSSQASMLPWSLLGITLAALAVVIYLNSLGTVGV